MLEMNVMYIELVPKTLLDDITENRCIPFIGAGFSKNAASTSKFVMPDWNILGKKVAEYMGDEEFDNPVEALSQYENRYSRANLIEVIAKELHLNEVFPGKTHLSFCRLYFDLVCTTNFDFLLEDSFGEVYSKQGKPYHVITNENRLSTCLNEKTTILKLHGDFDNPKDMVITENDYDTFVSKNPLLCTYIANLLITRTPLLIGYSLNDPDLRMLWNIIGSRLRSLRRTGYAIMCSATESDIIRYKRRGINVINLPVRIEDYPQALETLFNELLEYWNSITEKSIRTSNEEAISTFKYGYDEISDLCLFSVPYNKLSLYKKYIFPIIEQYGFVPVAADDFIIPSENITAKINTLIQKARITIVDISTNNSNIFMELGIINEFSKPCLIVTNDYMNVPIELSNHKVVQGNFEDKLDDLVCSIENFLEMHKESIKDFEHEPKRLFDIGEYNAAIISAIRLLEIKLTKKWLLAEHNDTRSNAVIPLVQLIKIVGSSYGIDVELVKSWSAIRNKVVHSEYKATRTQCKKIVDGVYKIINELK